ncbi:MAG TPA: hypothetical protein VFW31_19670, partial [Candidatus Angelobacter sp.]|nr:hypothetical protein [Candidatus Angelobacter sp.]
GGFHFRSSFMQSHVEDFNTALFLAIILAFTLAAGFVLCVYGYIDHINSTVSLRVGGHDSFCMHQQCWNVTSPSSARQ